MVGVTSPATRGVVLWLKAENIISTGNREVWRAVYRHWRLGRLTPFLDRGLMLYSAFSTVTAIVVASVLWILLGWTDGASAVILAAVACSFFAAMDDPAPQIYRFFFWTSLSVLFASLYLFVILPNLHDFPMLVLAFAVPFICIGTHRAAAFLPGHVADAGEHLVVHQHPGRL